MNLFVDRVDAGRRLAEVLFGYRQSPAIVVGLARGGVLVGHGVVERLDLPLEALVVRKIGAPHNPELALGAISETGMEWLDPYLVAATGASEPYIRATVARELTEARRRQDEYHTGPGLQAIRGRPVLLVDDGIATGASAMAAIRSVRDLGALRVVVAAPVASVQAVNLLRTVADEVVVLDAPDPFYAVGLYYRDFDQVSDEDVVKYLEHAAHTARSIR